MVARKQAASQLRPAAACTLTLVVFVLPLTLLVLIKAAQLLNLVETPIMGMAIET